MTPKDVLISAKKRYFTTECRDVGAALAGPYEYPVYCRALFLLKTALGCDPRQSLFDWQRQGDPVPAEHIRIGFVRAIRRAEDDEVGLPTALTVI